MKRLVSYLILIFVSIWILWPIFETGLPATHDGQNHLGRMANYYLAVKQGQIPPRWAPNLNAGFGYPVLNFNYPLANILSVPLIAVNLGVENAYKSLMVLGYILGGVGTFVFLKRRFSEQAALFGAMLYISAPYQIMNIFVRGNIGETLSLSLLPWILLYIDKVVDKNKKSNQIVLTLLMAAMWLGHNLMVVLSVPMLGLYVLFLHGKKRVKKIAKPVILSWVLVAFFWLPAVGEMNNTIMASSRLNREYIEHFATFSELLFSPLSFGFSEPGPVDGMTFNVGLLNWVVVGLSLLIMLIRKRFSRFSLLFIFLFLFAFFMMLPASRLVWNLIPYAGFIQFPWRMLFITVIASSMLGAHLFDKIRLKWPLVLLFVIYLTMTSKIGLIKGWFSADDFHWFSFPLTTTVSQENDPKDFDRSAAFVYFSGDESKIKALEGHADVTVIDKWTGSSHRYELEASEDSLIVERTVYFPGWLVEINGKRVELIIDKDKTFGLISYRLPKGVHTIESKFTQMTPLRVVGNIISIIGIMALLFELKSINILWSSNKN